MSCTLIHLVRHDWRMHWFELMFWLWYVMRINAPCCLHAACTLHVRSEARTQLSRGFRFSSFFFLLTFETVRLVHVFWKLPETEDPVIIFVELQVSISKEGKEKEIQEELLQQFSRLGKTTKKPANSILAVHLCWVNLLLYKSTRAKPRCPPDSSTQDLRTLFKCMTCLGFSTHNTNMISTERGPAVCLIMKLSYYTPCACTGQTSTTLHGWTQL